MSIYRRNGYKRTTIPSIRSVRHSHTSIIIDAIIQAGCLPGTVTLYVCVTLFFFVQWYTAT